MPIKVKEVLSAAAEMAGMSELAKEIESGGAKEETAELLVRCFNLIENEVALDYFPLTAKERLPVHNSEIAYASLSHTPINIVSVTSVSGMGIRFDLLTDSIGLREAVSEAIVEYAFAPVAKKLGDASDFEGKISARLLSLGVAAEFMLARGLFSEASVFDKKYREALRAAAVVRHRLALRARRWA